MITVVVVVAGVVVVVRFIDWLDPFIIQGKKSDWVTNGMALGLPFRPRAAIGPRPNAWQLQGEGSLACDEWCDSGKKTMLELWDL